MAVIMLMRRFVATEMPHILRLPMKDKILVSLVRPVLMELDRLVLTELDHPVLTELGQQQLMDQTKVGQHDLVLLLVRLVRLVCLDHLDPMVHQVHQVHRVHHLIIKAAVVSAAEVVANRHTNQESISKVIYLKLVCNEFEDLKIFFEISQQLMENKLQHMLAIRIYWATMNMKMSMSKEMSIMMKMTASINKINSTNSTNSICNINDHSNTDRSQMEVAVAVEMESLKD